MNLDLLIDSIVRQTTVLIAQLATAGGGRAPLAHTANQVFVDLVKELKEQGLGNKVIADMFGLTLRTYQNRVRRLAESSTFKGRSLWEAVLDYVEEKGPVERVDVLKRFRADDERIVRAVLSDLVDTGVLFRSGRGDHTAYRAASPEELGMLNDRERRDGLEHLVLVTVSRFGPMTREEMDNHVRAPKDVVDLALKNLLDDGRVQTSDSERGRLYSSAHCVIPFGEPAGWEAAVFDHYQAMVTAIGVKLTQRTRTATIDDSVGGSTYTFDIWKGHPLEAEVRGLLRDLRDVGRDLRERVERYNREHPEQIDAHADDEVRVITYVGQGVLEPERDEGEKEW